MKPKIIIRKATMKDIKIIVKLWKGMVKYHRTMLKNSPKHLPHEAFKKGAIENFRNFAKKNIRSSDAIIFIAEVDNKIAGYSLNYIKKNISIFKIEKFGYISDLFVKEEFRGLKISSMIKDETMKWFKKKGMKYSAINVHSMNKRTRAIYKKWGFIDFHIEVRKKI